MTSTTFRSLGQWPRPSTLVRRGRFTFRAGWSDTLELLDRELRYLKAESVVIQADFAESDIRLDGMPRANARSPQHPGVILSFESKHGPLQYLTDQHAFWQHNVRAIALGLGALRAVDRYGITRTGQQYTGWRQLTAGSGLTTRQEAEALILRLSNGAADNMDAAYKAALKVAHPDHGGDSATLASVLDAGRLLGVRAP